MKIGPYRNSSFIISSQFSLKTVKDAKTMPRKTAVDTHAKVAQNGRRAWPGRMEGSRTRPRRKRTAISLGNTFCILKLRVWDQTGIFATKTRADYSSGLRLTQSFFASLARKLIGAGSREKTQACWISILTCTKTREELVSVTLPREKDGLPVALDAQLGNQTSAKPRFRMH
jgi:hypothetical protein